METSGPTDGDDAGIDYAALVLAALRDVVRGVLGRVAASGLPGDHHFLLSFGTAEDGVEIPERLRRQFPDEMTIVLQHQFWGLEADDRGFAVTLRFGGARERLVVPWSALRSFADPSAGFGLRLRPEPEPASAGSLSSVRESDDAFASRSDAPRGAPAQPEKVVDFGAFRRRGEDAG